jgi:hypothetical protein
MIYISSRCYGFGFPQTATRMAQIRTRMALESLFSLEGTSVYHYFENEAYLDKLLQICNNFNKRREFYQR